ncbi:MAG TPA: hypothetical protein O0X50_03635 [Methanocorpusculum sp.]|nr:hypothetical protein [Methanocorpusculum sp.]
MTTAARISTPVYLDPANGPHCGSCQKCAIDGPYHPSNFGLCQPHDTIVNIRRKTTCRDYLPIEVHEP